MMKTINADVRIRRPLKPCVWFRSLWFNAALAGVLASALMTGLATGAPSHYLLVQFVLAAAVYVSFGLLSDRPLLNPVQMFVFMFYWWFGVAPTVIGAFAYLVGQHREVLEAQTSSIEGLWIVAAGLPLFAIAARVTLRSLSGPGAVYARFLMPRGHNYRTKTLLVYFGTGFAITCFLLLLKYAGIQGQEETSYFGGTRTTIWWVGLIVAFGGISVFGSSALMTAAVEPWRSLSPLVRAMILILVAQALATALVSGSKGPFIYIFLYYACAYLAKHQRPPWLLLAILSLAVLLFIAPFVTYAREEALRQGATSSQERKEIFWKALTESGMYSPESLSNLDVAVFFRGIYPLAAELTRRNTLLHGEWEGYTIAWGFEVLIPRAIKPDKRDTNIGNFFGRTVGVDIGAMAASDEVTNLSLPIPFEFVGNYGWFAGVLSFGVLGVFWSLWCGLLLSVDRLSDHPLTPMMVLTTLGMEAAMGHFLASLRAFLFLLIVAYFIYSLLNRKL